MMQAVIIHGPQGCGKTRHAKDFCELYGCTAWTDDWLPGEPLVPGLLHLTFEVPSGLPGRDVQIISFDEAMKALGEKIVVRHLGTTTWQGPANQAPEFLGAQPGHNIGSRMCSNDPGPAHHLRMAGFDLGRNLDCHVLRPGEDLQEMKDHPAAASGAKREKLHVLPYDLVPFQEMTDAYVRVAEFGAKKYEPWNWSKGLSRVQILGSLLRHTFAYLRGEETDKDSGLSHTDHIIWNAVTLTHNVRWNLEDGRRVEPLRGYKLPADDATYLDHVNVDGTVTKVRIDPDEPLLAQVRAAIEAESDPGAFFATIQAAERHDQ